MTETYLLPAAFGPPGANPSSATQAIDVPSQGAMTVPTCRRCFLNSPRRGANRSSLSRRPRATPAGRDPNRSVRVSCLGLVNRPISSLVQDAQDIWMASASSLAGQARDLPRRTAPDTFQAPRGPFAGPRALSEEIPAGFSGVQWASAGLALQNEIRAIPPPKRISPARPQRLARTPLVRAAVSRMTIGRVVNQDLFRVFCKTREIAFLIPGRPPPPSLPRGRTEHRDARGAANRPEHRRRARKPQPTGNSTSGRRSKHPNRQTHSSQTRHSLGLSSGRI
jgi:hypothetical protein